MLMNTLNLHNKGLSLFPISKTNMFIEQLEKLSLETLKQDKTYPLYNIYKKNNEVYLEIAATGFAREQLNIYYDDNNLLVIEANKDKDDREYLHKNLTTKNFIKKFELIKHKVENVIVDDGLITIHLI